MWTNDNRPPNLTSDFRKGEDTPRRIEQREIEAENQNDTYLYAHEPPIFFLAAFSLPPPRTTL